MVSEPSGLAYWTYLERAPATWPASWQRLLAHRAHFLRTVDVKHIEVEFLNGDRAIWPLAECRRLGA